MGARGGGGGCDEGLFIADSVGEEDPEREEEEKEDKDEEVEEEGLFKIVAYIILAAEDSAQHPSSVYASAASARPCARSATSSSRW